MIDIWSLLINTLWIIGLALLLVTSSYVDWRAAQRRQSFRIVLREPGFQSLIAGGFLLISLGLLLLSNPWWERLIWLAFAGLFALQLWQTQNWVRIRKEDG